MYIISGLITLKNTVAFYYLKDLHNNSQSTFYTPLNQNLTLPRKNLKKAYYLKTMNLKWHKVYLQNRNQLSLEYSGTVTTGYICTHVVDEYHESVSKVAQSCLTLCDPMDFVHSFQARILEWVAIFFSRRYSWLNLGLPHCRQTLYHQGGTMSIMLLSRFSRVRLCATP